MSGNNVNGSFIREFGLSNSIRMRLTKFKKFLFEESNKKFATSLEVFQKGLKQNNIKLDPSATTLIKHHFSQNNNEAVYGKILTELLKVRDLNNLSGELTLTTMDQPDELGLGSKSTIYPKFKLGSPALPKSSSKNVNTQESRSPITYSKKSAQNLNITIDDPLAAAEKFANRTLMNTKSQPYSVLNTQYSLAEQDKKVLLDLVKQIQSLRVPFVTILDIQKYANSLAGGGSIRVKKEDIIKKFSNTWNTINLGLFQSLISACSTQNSFSVYKMEFFVDKYQNYVKLNNNHFNDSDQFKLHTGLVGYYDETPHNGQRDKRMVLLTERLQERFAQRGNAFLYFDKNHDSKVYFEEFAICARSLLPQLKDEELRDMFSKLDIKKDHFLDYDEFCLLWEDKYILNKKFQKMEEAFCLPKSSSKNKLLWDSHKESDSELKSKKQNFIRLPSDRNPSHTYGSKTMLGDNMYSVITNGYAQQYMEIHQQREDARALEKQREQKKRREHTLDNGTSIMRKEHIRQSRENLQAARDSLDSKWKLKRYQDVQPRIEAKNELYTSFELLSRNPSAQPKSRRGSASKGFNNTKPTEKSPVKPNAANNLSLLLRNEKEAGKVLPNFNNNTNLRNPFAPKAAKAKGSTNDLNKSSLI